MDSKPVELCNLRRRLAFNLHDVIDTKQQTVLGAIKDAFEGENTQTEYSVLGYRIDIYFHDYRLAIERDECGHSARNINCEIQ